MDNITPEEERFGYAVVEAITEIMSGSVRDHQLGFMRAVVDGDPVAVLVLSEPHEDGTVSFAPLAILHVGAIAERTVPFWQLPGFVPEESAWLSVEQANANVVAGLEALLRQQAEG